jgi:hypothetical protein
MKSNIGGQRLRSKINFSAFIQNRLVGMVHWRDVMMPSSVLVGLQSGPQVIIDDREHWLSWPETIILGRNRDEWSVVEVRACVMAEVSELLVGIF